LNKVLPNKEKNIEIENLSQTLNEIKELKENFKKI